MVYGMIAISGTVVFRLVPSYGVLIFTGYFGYPRVWEPGTYSPFKFVFRGPAVLRLLSPGFRVKNSVTLTLLALIVNL